jgi:hypothetical protein
VASPLFGYGLETLRSRLPESSHILCVEHDSLLSELAREAPILRRYSEDPSVTLVLDADLSSVRQTVARLGPARFRRVRLVSLSGGFSLYRDFYRGAQRACESLLRTHWQNKMTRIHMGWLWLRNLMDNLPRMRDGRRIDELHSEKVPVVVGAGPSLEFAAPALRSFRDKLYIICVDTALRGLAAREITPDLVVVLEAQQHNLSDFIGCFGDHPDARTSRSNRFSRSSRGPAAADQTRSTAPPYAIAADITAHPASIRRVPSESLYLFASRFADTQLFERLDSAGLLPPVIPALGSVGVVAARIASQLGRGPVHLVGLDFAYYDERTHARGTPPVERELMHFHRLRRYAGSSAKRRAQPLRNGKQCAEAHSGGARPDPHGAQHLKTDAILDSYAEQLRELIREAPDRYRDLGVIGTELGAELCCDAQATLQETTGALAEEAPEATSPEQRKTGEAEALGEFCSREAEQLREIVRLGRLLVAQADEPQLADDADYRRFAEAVSRCDYVFMDFPDPEEEPQPTVSFVSRAATAAAKLVKRLERLTP